MSRRKLPVLTEQAIGSVKAESAARSQAFERQLRRQGNLSCRPGCSNCCYLPIEISILEAIPIYRELVQKGRWTPAFVKTLQEHAGQTNLLAPTVWMLLRLPCPLLRDNRCSVYDVRPFHCRTMWATGDPFYCDGRNFSPNTTLVPKGDLVSDFVAYEGLASKQAGMPNYMVPISRALLVAEKVVAGQMDAVGVIQDILQDM